jgi:hypothetical protein
MWTRKSSNDPGLADCTSQFDEHSMFEEEDRMWNDTYYASLGRY